MLIIKKQSSKVVHGGAEAWDGMHPLCNTSDGSGWVTLEDSTAVTCKKCLKHIEKAESLGLHLEVRHNADGSSRVVDTRDEIAEQAAYIEEGIEIDEADDAEQSDRASYYSGAVPCFERTTVDGIGYGCVKLGEHVEHNTALGAAWWVAAEQADTGKIAITKYSGHEAFGTAVFEGRSIGGHATRERGRWVLRVEMGRTIRAKTLGKVARQWAKSLGFYAATIDVETMR